MRKIYLVIFFGISITTAWSQAGTPEDPFTSLGQARNSLPSGMYAFNLSGTSFISYVDNGFVLVAVDFGNGTGSLPQSTTLSNFSRGILTPAVLSALTDANEVRVMSGTGAILVTSANATIINRITTNTTLHQGVADNTINNTWTGTGSSNFTADAACPTANGAALNNNVFDPCNSFSGFFWVPSQGIQRDVFTSGEVGNGISFRLFVRAPFVALLAGLLSFEALQGKNATLLQWTSENEINLQEFEIQYSPEGAVFHKVGSVLPSPQSSSSKHYHFEHMGGNRSGYYRLRVIDFGGRFAYSQTVYVQNRNNNFPAVLYPNPVEEVLNIDISLAGIPSNSFVIYDATGKPVYDSKLKGVQNKINVAFLPPGLYTLRLQIRGEIRSYKFIK